MSRQSFLFLIVISSIIFLGSSCSQQTESARHSGLENNTRPKTTVQKNDMVPFQSALPDQEEAPEKFQLQLPAAQYLFHNNGIAEQKLSNGEKRVFQLPMDRYDTIGKIHFFQTGHRLGILYDYTDGASSAASLVYLDTDTLQIKWQLDLPTYDTGSSLLVYPYLYVTAMGFIGKVDLEKGELLWNYDELYKIENGGFRRFATPQKEGHIIKFPEQVEDGDGLIQIDDRTGRRVFSVK